VIESLAAGTPVIASPRGSMIEIIRPHVTGYLVDDVAAAVTAVTALGEIARADCRADCRADASARFSADRMVDDYERLFYEITTRSS
jgi:glycosyltransferase involved in cell wall biosynthesis